MKKVVAVFFSFLAINLNAQDSLSRKPHLYVGINPVLFIDYNGFNAYPGLDLSFGYQEKIMLGEIGILAGNSYPVLPYLNYYLATGISVPLNKRFEFQPRFRFMLSHYSHTDPQSLDKTTRSEESINVGAALLLKFRRIRLGVEYYSWWSNYYYTYEPNYPVIPSTSDSRHGFVPTGIFALKMICKLNKQRD